MKKLFLLVFLLNFIFCYADSQLDEELIEAAKNGDVKLKKNCIVGIFYIKGEITRFVL
jgi:hypothetical protein